MTRNKTTYTATKEFIFEWLTTALTCFLLFDLIWLLIDFNNFKENALEYYHWIYTDIVYCCLFSLVSTLIGRHILKWRIIRTGSAFVYLLLCGLTLIAANVIIALCCDCFIVYVVDSDFLEDDIWGNSFLFGIITSFLALARLTVHYSKLLVKKNQEYLALQKKYLKLQLDPHFTFNNLGSLTGMIEVDPKRAEKYVVSLARVYRHLLKHIDTDYILISEAGEFAKEYITMLNLRYDDKIVLHADIASAKCNEYILALSLQLLIENAVKHNQPYDQHKLHITLCKTDDMLIISNNIIYPSTHYNQAKESYGIGIGNLRKRYKMEEIDKEIQIKQSAESFTVELPIIKKSNNKP